MAGRGPAPKPAAQRRRSNRPAAGEWVALPREGRRGRTPPWPVGGSTPAQRGLWQRLWRTPQATMWDGLGVGTELVVARYVKLTLEVDGGEQKATEYLAALPELRQLEDRLGLSPKGMQERRWRIDADETVAEGPDAKVTAMADYRKLLEEAPAVE